MIGLGHKKGFIFECIFIREGGLRKLCGNGYFCPYNAHDSFYSYMILTFELKSFRESLINLK